MPRKNRRKTRNSGRDPKQGRGRKRIKPKPGDPVERFAWHVIRKERLKKEVEPGTRFPEIRAWLEVTCSALLKQLLREKTTTHLCRLAKGDNTSRKRHQLINSAIINVLEVMSRILAKYSRRRLTAQH